MAAARCALAAGGIKSVHLQTVLAGCTSNPNKSANALRSTGCTASSAVSYFFLLPRRKGLKFLLLSAQQAACGQLRDHPSGLIPPGSRSHIIMP